jgi:CO/xanthine dehydrogenase FAD-binding subunit
MKPAAFDYLAPTTVEEALSLLEAAEDADAKLLAGGQSLVPTMNLRMARPAVLIDLNRVAGLEGISCADGEWRIGAMTRHATIEDSSELAAHVPVLPAVVAEIGYRPIRNRGTVGGSLCHADPSAVWPLLACLLRMDIDVRSVRGRRTVAADEFFEGIFTTAIAVDELLTAVRFRLPAPTWRWGFSEFARKAGDFALAAAGVVLAVDGATITKASVVVVGTGREPLRLEAVETALAGTALDDEDAVRHVLGETVDGLDVTADLHAPEAYRRRLVGVQVERALAQARGSRHEEPTKR